ncbi:MAG: metallophosphoesterase [Deltaproteobacteria bacterium]|nr:metallophosphoesterase [Deltaproteobacteria bacterium]
MSRAAQIAIFLGISTLLVGSFHYYFWTRLVRDTALPPPFARLGTLALIALAVSIPLAFILGRVLDRPMAALSWIAFGWMGIFFLMLVGLVAGELVRLVVATVTWAGDAPLDPERRLLLARGVAGAASAFATAAGATGLYATLRPVDVKRVEVALKKLPRALDGFTLAVISDVHLGPTIGAEFMEDVVKRMNALSPDLVAIAGDLVDGSVEELAAAAAPLQKLQAKHGVFFITGNHEYYSGAPEWLAHLRTLGIRTLENERVTVAEHLELAGCHDLAGRSFGMGHDLDRALQGFDGSRPLVLLSHQPKTFPESAKKGVDLQISGHTHGGQIWPWGYLVKLQQGFLAGLSKLGDAQLYVSRGTGYWGPPMRLGAPAEITQITLRATA